MSKAHKKKSAPGVRDPRIPVEVVISRKRHVRGTVLKDLKSIARSALLVGERWYNKNQMCCLGFVARKAGLKASEILDYQSYSDLRQVERAKIDAMFPKLFDESEPSGRIFPSLLHGLLITINDNRDLSDEECEEQLTSEGLRAGIKFIFVP